MPWERHALARAYQATEREYIISVMNAPPASRRKASFENKLSSRMVTSVKVVITPAETNTNLLLLADDILNNKRPRGRDTRSAARTPANRTRTVPWALA